MKKLSLTIVFVLVLTLLFVNVAVLAEPIPTISILSVDTDDKVTVQTHNFPANRTFQVLMGKMGTKGIGGIYITSIDSGSGGSFTETFNIPAELKGDYRIAIRLQATSGGYYAFNWFYNNTTTSQPITGGYKGIPTFSITDVEKDKSVTIRTNNFPANYDFKVLMGKMGTKGIGGIHVTTISSDAGGSFNKTFDIPAELKGDYQIAIRLEATSGGFYAFNWFYNNTTTSQAVNGGTSSGYTGIPTFSIIVVVKDSTVTIRTNNFPANYDFKVLMGKMGTKGIGGIHVATISSGAGGTFTETFDVPAALMGNYQIAIRLEAPGAGFYAFNWFYNNTYP
jgi:hypothetical protein